MNLGGIANSLRVSKGEKLIKYVSPRSELYISERRRTDKNRKYSAIKARGTPNEQRCSSERSFCSNCSTMLWLWDHHYPELIHPFASAIDTDLPVPKEMVCVMDSSKPNWVRWPEGAKSTHEMFGGDSLEGWHKKHMLFYD